MGSCFSTQELDVDSETCIEFVQKHVRRLVSNAAAKEGCFSAESEVYGFVRAYQKAEVSFQTFSVQLCERLSNIMQANKDIPAADILIADVEDKRNHYLAVIKLNYGECFTHRILNAENGIENQIIKHTTVLPGTGVKVEEACLIPYDPMVLRILEKSHHVDGEDRFYFSELFLQCESQISQKETVEILQQIAQDVNAKYYDDNIEMAARLKCAFIDESEGLPREEPITLDNVTSRVFMENPPAQEEFLQAAKESGLPHGLNLSKSVVRREFKTQKFKADNGIELKFPSELFQDPEIMQFATNSDGTVSITLKNLRKC